MLKKISIILSLCYIVTLNAQDYIVLDKKQNLEWQDTENMVIDVWKISNAICKQLELDGNGWRLPKKEELIALSKDEKLKQKFHSLRENIFWTLDKSDYDAITIFSGNGFESETDTCEKYATICVRDLK